ncbi:MAG: hypothetical protein FWE12_01810 [Oscillospiraceae bacterium]|nr:hypothetical protein [Oscillospiraceae bacterium]
MGKQEVVGILNKVDKLAVVAIAVIVLMGGIVLWALAGIISTVQPPDFGTISGMLGIETTTPTPTLAPVAPPPPTPTAPQPNEEHALVGIWAWDGNHNWQYNFNANGQAIRGVDAAQSFTWEAEDGYITMRFADRTERWSYVIVGDRLTLTSGQHEYHYYRMN